jgi:hypothetical protein
MAAYTFQGFLGCRQQQPSSMAIKVMTTILLAALVAGELTYSTGEIKTIVFRI